MNMIIKKILNNNVVITTNYQMEEIIVMGKGLAYGKQAGDNIDMNKINKTFEVSLKPSQRKMINMLKDIPLEYMEISDCVIKEAKVDLEVDDSLYISLTDHIHTSIERYKEGVYLKNHMLFEIKNFYSKEFELGLFFGLRVFNKIKQVEDITLNNDLLEIMKEKYVESYLCTSKIQSHIEKTYHYELNDEEVLYLTIHVAKIISKK